jgi:hypothetical protein
MSKRVESLERIKKNLKVVEEIQKFNPFANEAKKKFIKMFEQNGN